MREALELRQKIVDEARKLGFDAIGFAVAEPLDTGFLEDWLEQGYHGEMDYMARDTARRLDPEKVLPGARTVVSVAVSYHQPEVDLPPPGAPRISRYALGRDYHHVIEEKLAKLSDFIREQRPDARARIAVDHAPVADKIWARLAGLGWVGKHSNLIHPKLGSWIFLGEILLDIDLEPDPAPSPDLCGTCTACIDACPTGAIVEPYVVDATRCISYHTVEKRGDIDEQARPGLGSWIFGCDICQDVCPWNRKVPPASEEAFRPEPHLLEAEPGTLMTLARESFKRHFGHAAIERARRGGFLRNLAVVLGNLQREEDLPLLGLLALDPDPAVRRHAAWALGRMGRAGERLLRQRARKEEDPSVREAIERALGPGPLVGRRRAAGGEDSGL